MAIPVGLKQDILKKKGGGGSGVSKLAEFYLFSV